MLFQEQITRSLLKRVFLLIQFLKLNSSIAHFLIHCPTFNDERYTLLSTLNNIDPTLLELTKSSLSQTLLHGNTLFDKEKNTRILNATIEYILSTERFEEPLI